MSMVDTREVPAGTVPPAGPPLNVPKKKRHPGVWIGVTALVVLALFPVWWILTSAVTPAGRLLTSPPSYFPRHFTLGNFSKLAEQLPIGQALLNSILLAVLSSVLAVGLSYLAAYAFARYTFPGSNAILVLLLLSSALPQVATVIPLFQMYSDLNLTDTIQGLVLLLSSMLTPFTVWILTTFIRRVPMDIEDAARIDGAGFFRIVFRVTGPLTAPAIATMLVINFVQSWNEVFFPLIFAQTPQSQPLSLGLLNLSASVANAGRPWDLLSALTVILVVPVIIVVIAFEPFITRGLAAGADK
jgi:ABC-type glycerol-3-phosphate transport system permease component